VTSEQRCFAIGAAFAISILVVHSWFDFNLHIPANGLLFCAILGLVAGMEVPEGPYSPRPLKPLSRYLLVFVLLLGVAAGLYYIIPAARATRLTGIADQEKRYLYWDDAIGHYNAAIKLDPRYPRPWTKLGDVYYTQAKFRGDDKKEERVELARKAAKHYETAFELNRSRGAVLAKLAGAYEVTEEFDKARRCFEKAIELDSNNATIHSQYGLFLRRRGEDKEAIQTFEKVRKLYANPISELNLWELQGNTL
jgi:tetratricopeptide (TPR) repeat protein